jgi:hypothetical protein
LNPALRKRPLSTWRGLAVRFAAASLPARQQVHHPAAADVLARLAAKVKGLEVLRDGAE